jgi:hypothetical protein
LSFLASLLATRAIEKADERNECNELAQPSVKLVVGTRVSSLDNPFEIWAHKRKLAIFVQWIKGLKNPATDCMVKQAGVSMTDALRVHDLCLAAAAGWPAAPQMT